MTEFQRPEGWGEWHDRLERLGIVLKAGQTAWRCPHCGKRHPISSITGLQHLRIMEESVVAGVLVTKDAVTLVGDEAIAMDHLIKAGEIIFGWQPKANLSELGTAIHVVQGFIVQHMLHRLNPAHWTSWYKED